MIIHTANRSYDTYAVGRIVEDDQQDFHGAADVTHAPTRAAAVAEAHAQLAPGRRIFLRNLDTDAWSEIVE